jgi:hypothetical protein
VKVYGSRAALRPTPLLAPALSRHPAVMRSARRAVIADPSNREPLGLAVYRERGRGRERGAVFFLGGGLLEVSGSLAEPASGAVGLFLQVRDLRAARERLAARGVPIDPGAHRPALRRRSTRGATRSGLDRGRRQRHLGPAQLRLGQQSLAGRRWEYALERGERLAGLRALLRRQRRVPALRLGPVG